MEWAERQVEIAGIKLYLARAGRGRPSTGT